MSEVSPRYPSGRLQSFDLATLRVVTPENQGHIGFGIDIGKEVIRFRLSHDDAVILAEEILHNSSVPPATEGTDPPEPICDARAQGEASDTRACGSVLLPRGWVVCGLKAMELNRLQSAVQRITPADLRDQAVQKSLLDLRAAIEKLDFPGA